MKPSLEAKIPRLALLGGLPAVVVALYWLWTGEHGIEVRWTLTVLVLGAWIGCALAAHERVVRPLQVVANLLAALREGAAARAARRAATRPHRRGAGARGVPRRRGAADHRRHLPRDHRRRRPLRAAADAPPAGGAAAPAGRALPRQPRAARGG